MRRGIRILFITYGLGVVSGCEDEVWWMRVGRGEERDGVGKVAFADEEDRVVFLEWDHMSRSGCGSGGGGGGFLSLVESTQVIDEGFSFPCDTLRLCGTRDGFLLEEFGLFVFCFCGLLRRGVLSVEECCL